MQVLTFDEVMSVNGGITETQCVAAVSAIGGGIGAGIGGYTTAGFGAWAGFEGGALIGGMAGGLACGFFFQ